MSIVYLVSQRQTRFEENKRNHVASVIDAISMSCHQKTVNTTRECIKTVYKFTQSEELYGELLNNKPLQNARNSCLVVWHNWNVGNTEYHWRAMLSDYIKMTHIFPRWKGLSIPTLESVVSLLRCMTYGGCHASWFSYSTSSTWQFLSFHRPQNHKRSTMWQNSVLKNWNRLFEIWQKKISAIPISAFSSGTGS